MHNRDVLGSLMRTHPREVARFAMVGAAGIWCSVPAILGLGIFLCLTSFKRSRLSTLWLVGIGLAVISLAMECYQHRFLSLSYELTEGWELNVNFWWLCGNDNVLAAFLSVIKNGFNFMVGIPVLVAACLATVDLIPMSAHQRFISALHHGKNVNKIEEISNSELATATANLDDRADGTTLGISRLTGKPVVIADHDINHVVFVLGTTGGGKTVTLRRFYQRAIKQGYPLIIVDGKPTDENVQWLQQLAQQHQRSFYGFNCGNFDHYDPLANGGYTELKDKIISLKDHWENDYYRSIAEDYLQTTLQVLLKSRKPFDLASIVQCLNYEELVLLARSTKDAEMLKRVTGLEHYERSDITGLQAHLNLLIHSELGDYFNVDQDAFQLTNVIDNNAIVYFALPALRFPSFSKVLGKLVINDLKAVIDRCSGEKRVFMVFDEFSVFAGDQVLNLVNMGRGKGVHAIFGTQGLADLDKVDAAFKDQLLNCANTIICHRLNDQKSAETIASWIGTKDTFNVTAQLDIHAHDATLGTVKQVKEFIVHPDDIKQTLNTGDAFLISKVGGFRQDKIKVKYS